MNVYKKLMQVQAELNCPKDLFNKFGNYSYRSAESILESLKPLLKKHGAVVNISDNLVLIGDRYYVESTASFIDADTGEKVEVKALAREEESKKGMDASQLTGSTSSYARKYALNGLFAIDDNKDSDSTNTHGKNENKADTKANNKIYRCTTCAKEIDYKVAKYSYTKFKKCLCVDCQKKIDK